MASSESNTERDEFVGSVENITDAPSAYQVYSFGTRMMRRRGAGNNIPLITLEPRVHHVFRYQKSGETSAWTVDLQNVAEAHVAASAANQYRFIMRTFRIKKVAVRGSIANVGSQATVSLRFLGANTNEIRYQDATFKVDSNAMVVRTPPRFSLASFWHDVTNEALATQLFQIDSSGTGELYVDLHLEYLLDVDRYINFSLSAPTGGLNSGGLYKGPLGEGLIPVGGTSL